MRIRVVDFAGNPGGGVRFTTELVAALRALHPELKIDLVTFGVGLEHYRSVFRERGVDVPLRPVRPVRYWRNIPASRIWGIPKTSLIMRGLGFGSAWHYEVPPSALSECDVVWFPWIHRHRLPSSPRVRLVGSFHDAIFFKWPGLLSSRVVREARGVVLTWLNSPARIAVGSAATRAIVAEMFSVDSERLAVIPPGWDHIWVKANTTVEPCPAIRGRRYILYAANTSPHKNHETLLRALAIWGAPIPVVLTGYGADLSPAERRGAELRQWAKKWGLQVDDAVIPLGYVSDQEYRALLAHAWAVVMPSFMEGGGSFPVMEAMMAGIPVISSDIPVMRELLSRVGGDLVWFDPVSAEDLAGRLRELETRYEGYRERAQAQAAGLRVPTWKEAAQAYWALMTRG